MEAKRFGRYRVTGTLGRGAMGEVYVAVDDVLGREVAIKTLLGDVDGRGARILDERFRMEARAIAQLAHPNVVQVFDVALDTDPPYFVMERVAGPSLRERLAERPLGDREFRALGIQIANALAAAHAVGVVHRDVKPANILAAGRDTWKLADFGVAHVPDSSLTKPGQFVGSPAYAPPEALLRGQLGPEGDIYGLAATLYQAITGRWPRSEATTGALLAPVPPLVQLAPQIAPGIADVIDRALAMEPGSRPSAGALASALARAATPIPAPPRSPASADPTPNVASTPEQTEFVASTPGAPVTGDVRRVRHADDEPANLGVRVRGRFSDTRRKLVIASVGVATVAAIAAVGAVALSRGEGANETKAERPPGDGSAPVASTKCTLNSLKCDQFSTQGRTGKDLHALVFSARLEGRHAEAICLAQNNLDTTDGWLLGATHFEMSNAWEALGCHELAVSQIEAALQRPRDRSWKDTCDWCVKIGARCDACEAPKPTALSNRSCVGVEDARVEILASMLELGASDGWGRGGIAKCIAINLPRPGWYVLGELRRDVPDQDLTVHVAVDAVTAKVVAIGKGGVRKYNHVCEIEFVNVVDGHVKTGPVVTMTESCVDKMGQAWETRWVARVRPPDIVVTGN